MKNKYWVDELYEVVFVLPSAFCQALWPASLIPVIDAAVLFPSRLARAG
ncbi:MAG: hypothetical protein R3B54_17045 [Bdellovibrionota bacterium]